MTTKSERFMTPAFRALGLSCVGVWGWLHAATIRTSGWEDGNAGSEILASFATFWIFTLPVAFLPVIGLPWRKKFVALAVLSCVCTLGAEIFARAQETLVLHRAGANPKADYTEPRWWPFEHHSLGIINGKRWGCD